MRSRNHVRRDSSPSQPSPLPDLGPPFETRVTDGSIQRQDNNGNFGQSSEFRRQYQLDNTITDPRELRRIPLDQVPIDMAVIAPPSSTASGTLVNQNIEYRDEMLRYRHIANDTRQNQAAFAASSPENAPELSYKHMNRMPLHYHPQREYAATTQDNYNRLVWCLVQDQRRDETEEIGYISC